MKAPDTVQMAQLSKSQPGHSDGDDDEEERFACLIQKCPNMRTLGQIHAYVLTRPLPTTTVSFFLNKIVSFCALSPLGDIHHACRVFSRIPSPSIFAWNSIIRGCSQAENPSREPLFIFRRLVRRGYPSPNTYTLAFVLKACSIVLAFREGLQAHARVVRSGYLPSPFVQTALVNFYGKCEEIGSARKVFDEIPERNLVAWSTMISGYARIGSVNETMGLFREMQEVGVAPDRVTLVSVISACAVAGALDIGRWVHIFVKKNSIGFDLELSTSLVNMYAKCGCIERAKNVFEEMPVKDTKAWSSLIVGLAINGLAEDALGTFSRMLEAKVKPNHVTFIGVLSACAHSGLVNEGRRYWASMHKSGIEPSMEHYGCMVDILCRADLIEEAYALTVTMPFVPNPVIWRTLLVCSKRNRDLDKGELFAKRLLELEPLNAENYILISNLYASASKWEKMSHVRKKMKDSEIRAVPGCSSIEVYSFVHEFVTGDKSHPEAKEIQEVLREISQRVHDAGHKPRLSAVLHDVVDEEKHRYLCEHSERLAIAYGLLKTKAPVVIRVVKNLRVCDDCHEVIKVISRLYGREIVVRDRVRFHKFVGGSCSCGNYW